MNVTSFERVRERGHTGLRPAHSSVLVNLERSGGRITEIARLEGVSKNAISQLAAELVDLGYIERTPDPTDGRAKILRYTKRGSQAIGKEIDAEISALVGEKKVTLLGDLLDEIETERARRPGTRQTRDRSDGPA